jgi:hypothetical protein
MIREGQVLRIGEADYCYGLGLLTLRVTRDVQLTRGLEWVEIEGVEQYPNGREGKERVVLVRVTALHRARSSS